MTLYPETSQNTSTMDSMEDNIRDTIENGTTFQDLSRLAEELIPIDVLKAMLSEQVDKIVPSENDTRLSLELPTLRALYLKTGSFHEIFPETIQAKIIGFIASTDTYRRFPCISSSFRHLFINFPGLYKDVKLPHTLPPKFVYMCSYIHQRGHFFCAPYA